MSVYPHAHMSVVDLSYLWKIRNQIAASPQSFSRSDGSSRLIDLATYSFKYIEQYSAQIARDPSLAAICQLCTHSKHRYNTGETDEELTYLSKLFNRVSGSTRVLYQCYDCGTVARAVFLALLRSYRHRLYLSPEETTRLKQEYYMNRYKGAEGIQVLRQLDDQNHGPCLYLCAFQVGGTGHIYVIEKQPRPGSRVPKYRMYQSSLNAYLLIDYIAHMQYPSKPSSGISFRRHLADVSHMLTAPQWGAKEDKLFVQWYHFPLQKDTDEVDGTGPSVRSFVFYHVNL